MATERTFTPKRKVRTFTPKEEDRTYTPKTEIRTVTIPGDDRTKKAISEIRTFSVEWDYRGLTEDYQETIEVEGESWDLQIDENTAEQIIYEVI